jgi:hypothetical protein
MDQKIGSQRGEFGHLFEKGLFHGFSFSDHPRMVWNTVFGAPSTAY